MAPSFAVPDPPHADVKVSVEVAPHITILIKRKDKNRRIFFILFTDYYLYYKYRYANKENALIRR
jgi:hypothetical protein